MFFFFFLVLRDKILTFRESCERLGGIRMSKESVLKAAPAIKILPPQITKLKKEEEEETWISGEELYTEGSSDEENCRCNKSRSTDVSKESSPSLVARPHRSKGKSDKKLPRATHFRSTSVEDSDDTLHQSTSKSHQSPSSIACTDEEEEYVADDEISWKANRGTGALPASASKDHQIS